MTSLKYLTEELAKQSPDARLVFECGRDSTSEFEIKSLGPTEVRIVVAADSRVEVLEKEAQEFEEYTGRVATGIANALKILTLLNERLTSGDKQSLEMAISHLESVK